MGRRKIEFAPGEYYHIYNRGVDKRRIFMDFRDTTRFIQSMTEFNSEEPIGSLYENSFRTKKVPSTDNLVNIIAYCLNPNHFHFILEEVKDNGISKYMQRLLGGYTMYFNTGRRRSGALFQGRFKAIHIDTDEYLEHVSVYVNLNNLVHQLGGPASKLVRSSWSQYTNEPHGVRGALVQVKNDIVLAGYKNKNEYKKFALEMLRTMIEQKRDLKEIEEIQNLEY